MIDFFNSLITMVSLPSELAVISLILLHKVDFKKRNLFARLLSTAILISIFIAIFYITLSGAVINTTESLIITYIYCVVCYLLVLGLTFLNLKMDLIKAIYILNMSYLLQHFTHSIFLILNRALNVKFYGFFELLIFVISFAFIFFIVGNSIMSGIEDVILDSHEVFTTLLVIGVAIFLSAIAKAGSADNTPLYYVCNGYAMIFCFYAIWIETQKREKQALEKRILLEQQTFLKYREQYEISQENIALINRKCHDLKHQISALKQVNNEEVRNAQIKELEQAVMIYDSIVHTGNEILDTILTEKSLYCEANGIKMACVADGDVVKNIDPIDLYTIFGNALDNCLECVAKEDDEAKKVISVIVSKKSDMIFFQFENYYDSIHADESGKFKTTKKDKDFHGFGLESIKYTAEKYGGFTNIETNNNIFLLRIMIPIQNAD